MINKDNELEDCLRNGKPCNFIDYKGIAEISAQRIRALLLDPNITHVRIEGAVISGTLDLSDTLSVKHPPLGGLELIDCVILEPLHLERGHLTYLSLLKSAFTELHAQNCRIEGDVDLGHVYSSEDEEPESKPVNKDLDLIDKVFAELKETKNFKPTGLRGPDKWWKYETALNTELDPKDYKQRGRCYVDLSGALISGSLYLDGCRLVAPAIIETKGEELNEDLSRPAIILDNAKIDGDCFIRAQPFRSIMRSMSGSFLGKIRGRNIILGGDLWGCGGVYWGYSSDAVTLQGARIKGGVFFQKIETDKAVTRGQLNFLAAKIENWLDLSGLHCRHSAFSDKKTANTTFY